MCAVDRKTTLHKENHLAMSASECITYIKTTSITVKQGTLVLCYSFSLNLLIFDLYSFRLYVLVFYLHFICMGRVKRNT